MARLGLHLIANAFGLILTFPLAHLGTTFHIAGLTILAAINLLALVRCRIKNGSLLSWYRKPLEQTWDVRPVFGVLFGMIFLTAGLYVACFGQPSSGQQAMTRPQIIVFGGIFCLIGVGVILLALGHTDKAPDERMCDPENADDAEADQ